MSLFLSHSALQCGSSAGLAARQPASRPAPRGAFIVRSMVADAERTTAAEPEAPAAAPPPGAAGGELLAPPTRRPPIWRAPPSARTRASKYKYFSEQAAIRQEQRDERRAERAASAAASSPGPAPGNYNSKPDRTGRFDGGGRGPGGPSAGGPGGYNRGPAGGGGYNRGPATGGPGGYTRGPATGGYTRGPATGGPGGYNRGPAGPGGAPGSSAPGSTDNKSWGGRGKAGGGRGGGGGGWKDNRGQKKGEKINIVSRRKARQSRREERAESREANKAVREDIFEVGPEGMTVQDLADMLALQPTEVVKLLFMRGIMVQMNSTLDPETVKAVGVAYGVDVLDKDEWKVEDGARKSIDYIDAEDLEFLQARPPVVTVMGHVDHGKTSLLDFIRKTKVAAGEAGGITQAIGAYTCDVDYLGEDRQVTFLDTPGHEAFSAMRARGAKVTDIAIIIVAADDGVRPQTIEAISHANAAGVPIVVAINKIDKEGANPERVKQELTEHGLLPEEWGGKTPMVPISAKKGQGVDSLLETVLLVAELEELQCNPARSARGTVLEASLDKKAGAVSSLLVQAGTLRVGDAVQAGSSYGKVRQMRSPQGDVSEAGPSFAVQMLGLNNVPTAGDEFTVFESEADARSAAEAIEAARRLERLAEMSGGGNRVTLSSLASIDEDGDQQLQQRLSLILKADASGSVEAVRSALGALPQDAVLLRYLMAAPGEITTSDIDLAAASGGLILGFNVPVNDAVQAAAKRVGVEVRTYSIIYNLIDDVRLAMEGKLRSIEERISIGTAEVKAVFGSGNRRVAGCLVTDGNMRKDAIAVVKRGKRVVAEGKLVSLRRVKDDVKEVAAGTECGIAVEGFKEWEAGDKIEAFDVIQKTLKLEEAKAATADMTPDALLEA
ncbi:translation initiation factor IF-chloroplastic [Micractinium conductrix]|uniref:Translation initiation factor IF-2, chloroplastic n=1 Tax=Micractinium conductrix TaxID=554055 RepID=A0A2P6V806_9CHLO|nr:translation initiation factor IF-chloroplastic [Micractinium conductrix]|eukprot:PSC70224.1 translation initiation factor IF-chloroplastic [Micractinium conductrix]